MKPGTGKACSVAAREAGDPQVGTAPPARRWLLVEHPGPWGRAGYAGSGLPPPVVHGLHRWAEATSGRVVLVRRPGRAGQRRGARRRWFVVDSRFDHVATVTGTFTDEHELLDLIGSTDADTGGAGCIRPVTAGHDVSEPLVLVCTHGRHDTCCAVRGRPIAALLSEDHPDRVWECSHIGGCRFAPALVLLPHGFVLGSIPESAAGRVVTGYHAGVIDTRWLRGRSSLAPIEQAAQHAARSYLATSAAQRVDALQPVAVTGDGSAWQVRLASPDCVVHLAERRMELGRPLTCSMTAPGWQRVFDVLAVDPA